MVKQARKFDAAAVLDSDEAIAEYMAAAFETEDAAFIADAVGVVARARGMSDIARESGLSREQLYRSFSVSGNPTLKSMLAVMKALGMKVTATSVTPNEPTTTKKRKAPAKAKIAAKTKSRQTKKKAISRPKKSAAA
ncbi:MAG: addiction module antidote protein [Halioglobus sp.]